MLGKLMKYEWKATWKLLLAADLLIVAMTFLARWMVHVIEFSGDFRMVDFVGVMVLITYVGSMFAVLVGTAVFLIHRFYTSTYGDQGYLLHTLPVDTHYIIIAKTLVSAAWILIGSAVMYISVIFLVTDREDMFVSMMEGFVDVIEYMGAEKFTAFAMVMTVVAYLFSVFARVLKVAACISLGQLSPNHKLMLSFAWYIGIYLVQRIFQGIYFLFQMALHRGERYLSYFSNNWETSLLSGIIYCVVFYVLTWYVMDRRLNLD